jgi:hypothetical protein
MDDYGYLADTILVPQDEPNFRNPFNYEDGIDPSFVPSPWQSDQVNDVTDVINSTTSFQAAVSIGEPSLLRQFNVWYQGVHGYVSLAVCLFGIMSNGMNILVLTRRSVVCESLCYSCLMTLKSLLSLNIRCRRASFALFIDHNVQRFSVYDI